MSNCTIIRDEFIKMISDAVTGHPILQLIVLNPDNIEYVYPKILDTSVDGLKRLYDNYTLQSLKSVNNFQICTIYDVMYDDIVMDISNERQEMYDKLVEIYDQQVIDLFINNDKERIRNKIKRIIEFTMDKVYKTDTMIIQYFDLKLDQGGPIGVINIINDILKNDFVIQSTVSKEGCQLSNKGNTYTSNDLVWVTIKKKQKSE